MMQSQFDARSQQQVLVLHASHFFIMKQTRRVKKMKVNHSFSRYMIAFLAIATLVNVLQVLAVAPLEIYAYKFFDSVTGESVNLKGVTYYPRPNAGPLDVPNFDFFTEEYRSVWEPDIAYFQRLGLNAIRIYAVDPSKDHSGFMCALADAGIYVIIGLLATCTNCFITTDFAPKCYPAALKTRGQLIIASFSDYDSVLGFDAGNEVDLFTYGQPQVSAPCQKKFIRDMRAWIAGCKTVRQVPVGVVVSDRTPVELTDYYNCYTTASKDPYELASWVGINLYRDCQADVTELSNSTGYQALIADFSNYSIPLLLSEYGCINPSFPTIDGFHAQRSFNQSRWIFEPGMKDTLAGGFAFEFSVEAYNAAVPFPYTNLSAGNFGIGYYSPADCDHINITCTYNPKPEFDNLRYNYAATQTRGEYNVSDFVPPADRLLRSVCPPNFDSIDNFTWPADSLPDTFCPFVANYTCPGPPSATPSFAPTTTAAPTVTRLTPVPTMSGNVTQAPSLRHSGGKEQLPTPAPLLPVNSIVTTPVSRSKRGARARTSARILLCILSSLLLC